MAVLLIDDGYFYIRKVDNNYSISMTIFGYNPKLSFQHWKLRCFPAKTTKAATGGVLWKKLLIKGLCQFQRKTPVLESLFNKVAGLRARSFIKKRLQHRCFPVKLATFLRTSILKNICEQLVAKISTLQKKLFINFFNKIMNFVIITITFQTLKFLLSFCAVFANLFYKNIRSSLLC